MKPTISEKVEKLIEEQMRSGRYQTAEDLLVTAISQLRERDWLIDATPAEFASTYPGLRQQIQAGIDSARDGRVIDGERFFDELQKRFPDPGAFDATSNDARAS